MVAYEEPLLPIDALVRAAKVGIGSTKNADLVRALVREGIDPGNLTKNVSRWASGGNEPRYTVVLVLLKLAGMLDTAAAGQSASTAPADPLEALAIGVASLEKTQAEILEEVRASRAEREAARSPRRARPKEKTGRAEFL